MNSTLVQKALTRHLNNFEKSLCKSSSFMLYLFQSSFVTVGIGGPNYRWYSIIGLTNAKEAFNVSLMFNIVLNFFGETSDCVCFVHNIIDVFTPTYTSEEEPQLVIYMEKVNCDCQLLASVVTTSIIFTLTFLKRPHHYSNCNPPC